jgi:prepilin-type N-terminal cleavage/methylation domain-containing protein
MSISSTATAHARSAPGARGGFSLIEVMIAIAISATVLLMAAASVRSASASLRKMETISEENHLLVRGWLTAMDDVDYWNSHANPDFPYLAGPMADTTTVEVAGVDTNDHPWDKRPFRSVTFTDDLNPNLLLPHDPRSWYRGNNMVGTMPMARVAPSFNLRFVYLTTEDAIVAERIKTDGRQLLEWIQYPAGWEPWHMSGDYAGISRALAGGDGSTEFASEMSADSTNATRIGVSRNTTDFLPSTQWFLFSELGHMGAAQYLPPGAIVQLARPTTNRSVANIGDPTKFFDWGEIPWALASGSRLSGGAGFAPEAFLRPSPTDFVAGDMDNTVRRNMLPGFPGSGRVLTEVYASTSNGKFTRTDDGSRYRANRGTSNIVVAVDYETATSRHRATGQSGGSGSYLPTGGFYPGRVFRIGNEFDTKSLVDRTIIDPFRLATDENATTNSTHTELQSNTADRMERRFAMTTQHQPAAATNDDRLIASFADGLQMQHRIVRYRSRYTDINKVVVTVVNPDSGQRIDLSTRAIGSTWRGARQHWGWKSAQSNWPHGPMGDRYAP